MAFNLEVDNNKYSIDVDSNTPLLWVLRDELNLTGTKFGCGVGQCGACTVLVNGKATRACSTTISSIDGAKITTIENKEDKEINKLQKFWVQEDVAQCGYCQPGQIMNAAGLLKANSKPNEEQIISSMNGNICRCGTYNRIKVAIKKAVEA